MSAEIFKALEKQEITPEQAKSLLSSIKYHSGNIIIGDLDSRLTSLEAKK